MKWKLILQLSIQFCLVLFALYLPLVALSFTTQRAMPWALEALPWLGSLVLIGVKLARKAPPKRFLHAVLIGTLAGTFASLSLFAVSWIAFAVADVFTELATAEVVDIGQTIGILAGAALLGGPFIGVALGVLAAIAARVTRLMVVSPR